MTYKTVEIQIPEAMEPYMVNESKDAVLKLKFPKSVIGKNRGLKFLVFPTELS